VDEWLVFLGGLPQKLSHDELTWLDSKFRSISPATPEILCKWLVMGRVLELRLCLPR